MDNKNINLFRNLQYWPKNALDNFPIYLEYVLNDYLKQIKEDNFQPKFGRKLELITAYKNKGLVYSDIPEFIKEEYELPSRDEGIDVIKFDEKLKIIEVFQCKDFKNYVDDHHLGTFYSMLYKYPCFNNIKAYCVGSKTTRFKKNTKNIINYDLEVESKNILKDNSHINLLKTEPYTDLINNPYLKEYDEYEYVNLKNDNVKTIKKEFKKNTQPELRKCQKEAIVKIQYAIDNKFEQIRIKIPCGCGKTRIMYYFSELDQYKILIVVPRVTIAEEILRYFNEELQKDINTCWSSNHNDINSNVTLAIYNSVQTYINEKNQQYDIMFVDEAHNIIGSDLYQKNGLDFKSNMAKKVLNVNTKLKVFLSATIKIDSNIDYEFEYDEAVKEGLICQYQLHLYNNEYIKNTIYDKNEFEIYKKYLKNKDDEKEFFKYYNRSKKVLNILQNKDYSNVIIYCSTQNIAKFVNKYLKKHDILSRIIISKDNDKEINTTSKYRRKLLNDFRKNKFRVLCAVDCISEGTDLPIANTTIFFNDKNSEVKIVQCVGRVLRLDHKHGKKIGYAILISENNNKKEDVNIIEKYMNILLEYCSFNSGKSVTFHNKNEIITIREDIEENNKNENKNKNKEETENIIRDYPNYMYLLEIIKDYYQHHKIKPKGNTIWSIDDNPEENIGQFILKMEDKSYEHKIRQKLEKIFKNDIIYFKSVSDIDNAIEFYKQFYNIYGILPYKPVIGFQWKNIDESFKNIYQYEDKQKNYIIEKLTNDIENCLYCNDRFYIYEIQNKNFQDDYVYEIKSIFKKFYSKFTFDTNFKIDENEVLEIKELIVTMINNKYNLLLKLEEDLKISIIRVINSILILTDRIKIENPKKYHIQPNISLKIINYKDNLIYDELLDVYYVTNHEPLKKALNEFQNKNNILSKTILIDITNERLKNDKNTTYCYKFRQNNKNDFIKNNDITISLTLLSKLNNIPRGIRLYKMLIYHKIFDTEFENLFNPIYDKILNNDKINFRNIFYNECLIKTNLKTELIDIFILNQINISQKKIFDLLNLIIGYLFNYLYEPFEYTDLILFMKNIIKECFNNCFDIILNNALMDNLRELHINYSNYQWKDIIKLISTDKKFFKLYQEWKKNNIQIWIQIYDLINN